MTVLLASCAGVPLPASVKGGECRVFERPEYEVKGSKQYDQDWIDGNIEAGVGGCNWERPKARPAEIDAGAKVAQAAPAVPAPAPRRSGIWQRTKERVKKIVPRRSAPGVVTPVAAAPAPAPAPNPLAAPIDGTPATFDPPPTPAPEPPKPKRKPIDELLQPSK
jgi:hypothetical protein